MWRRGERLYALLVFLVVVLEAVALGGLGVALSGRLWGLWGYGTARRALFQAFLLTGVSLFFLSAYILLYHAYTEAKELRDRKAYEDWLSRFTQALFGEGALPPPPWPRVALEALLHLREMLQGDLAERVEAWLRQARPSWGRMLRSRFASRPARLDALDALAQARLPETLDLILPYLDHPDPVLRLAAARAGARVAQGEGLLALGRAYLRAHLPRGALLEALLLLEDRAEPVLALLLEEGGREERWAALEALGRLKLRNLASSALAFLEDPDPELKAAAMRALLRLGHAPKGHEEVLLAALKDEREFLRVHAARLLALLQNDLARRALWHALSDPSFYVRRAAAEGLMRLDPALLAQAAHKHPDPYGRAMAQQLLQEAA
ncbi:PBS lyase [Thermus scotoductus]|uniref:PBS lyase n=1 Tax=Thermus scotoductus TaxID=37636 RepID=A0A430S712_THESC|nr:MULTISPECIES: HEAT repeat domain-containing protein [Thermus]RTG94223.1 PBS lyase [Thermus scotoductus]RTH07462.1 PBS lyase [Thermus scotoductus]RTH10946.1 PBS lyase [Thermus scotoductus]RTH11390.1 PBS lyase [Thermus scotoductus]RTH16310.1 PBS lyase [Thermus scotoductus]